MSLTYPQFVLDLANMLVVPSTDPNFQIALPNIIDDSEQRLYRELDLLSTIVRDQSATLAANSRNFTFPQHFVVSESINIFTPVGTTTNRSQLVPVSREWLDAIWGNETAPTTPSVPQYYAMITDQQIIVGPPPDAAYTLEVVGTIRPAPLSSTNTTTYLSLNLPDLFFAASMVIGAAFLKDFGAAADDPKLAVTWEGHFQTLLQSVHVEEERKRYAAQAWTSKSPSPIATPPRA